ncbi:MAG TPA: ribosome maturation factor RimM [Terriglobia bacterium]|nr:ribosome maturation factor RimM [Terriglobia bacterium]
MTLNHPMGQKESPSSQQGDAVRLRKPQNPYLAIARIIRPQGRQGEVSAEITTDFPDRFQNLTRVYLETPGQTPRPFGLEHAWRHKGRIILKLAGIDSISRAEKLRGLHVLIPFEERIPLPEGCYYWSELYGCRVVTGSPNAFVEIGTVIAVEPTAGVPLLRIEQGASGRQEILIPLAEEICRKVDLEAQLITIDPPEDLLELNDSKEVSS